MTRGVKIRIIAFFVLSAVGIVYVAAAYLGLVDKVLGRGYTVHATLPASGGLFEGSEVTYRGIKVGEVDAMHATRDGVRLDLALEEGTRIPLGSPMYVHNLSAVGEQYLDFEPVSAEGPYAEEGDTFTGSAKSLPVAEDKLLIELDSFVNSVNKKNLGTLVAELGDLFEGTGEPLQKLIDNGTRFIDEASKAEKATMRLLDNGLVVLKTQQDQGENIRGFARNLALLTDSLAQRDPELRRVLTESPAAIREVEALLKDLEPTLPTLLANLVTVNQVTVHHLTGIEQLLRAFPRSIAAGFTGTPGDGWGHVNLQFSNSVAPCHGEGYMPVEDWRRSDQTTDTAIYPARCLAGPPFNQRGSKYSPTGNALGGGARAPFGDTRRVYAPEDLSVLGGDAWQWLLVGPVSHP